MPGAVCRVFPPSLSMNMNREILRIALPNIVSNITVPLMGIVSTAIAGHWGSDTAATIGALAIGVSIFLQNYVSLAQTSDFVAFPQLITDFEFLDPISHIIGTSDFLIIVTSLVTMVALTLFIQYTKMGKAMRATAQNRKMAMLLGIDADRIISLTFIIGSSLAAIGGVLIANHVGQVNFFIGFIAGIKAFTAAVLGGIGSIPGAMVGGLVLGLCESFATGYISSAYEDALAFALLVLILIFRPAGILGKPKVQKV